MKNWAKNTGKMSEDSVVEALLVNGEQMSSEAVDFGWEITGESDDIEYWREV